MIGDVIARTPPEAQEIGKNGILRLLRDHKAAFARRFGAASARGFKALLAACPLDGVDLVRTRDAARGVEL